MLRSAKKAVLAGDVAERIGARPRLADLVQIVLALVGEIALSQFHVASLFKPRLAVLARAAVSTAWMIGS